MNADLTACVMFWSLTLLYTCKSVCDLAREKSLLSARPISEKCKRHDVHEAFRVSSRDKRLRQRWGVGMPWGSLEIEAPIPRPHLWQKGCPSKKVYARHVLASVALYLLICRCFPSGDLNYGFINSIIYYSLRTSMSVLYYLFTWIKWNIIFST